MTHIIGYLSLIALFVGLLFGRGALMSEAVLALPLETFELTIALIVNACLWNGLLNIAQDAGLVHGLSRKLLPLFKYFYPQVNQNQDVLELLATNFIANFIGLGSLAMISGLKAMQALDKLNHNSIKASRSMKTLIIFNTTGCSLFPMTIIAMRHNFHSQRPLGFIFYTLIIGVITLTIGILLQKAVEFFGK